MQHQYTPDEISYERFNLSDFLHHMAELFSHDTQLVIDIDVASDLIITANQRLMHRAIANLLSNTMRFAGTRIKVAAKITEGSCCIEVHDDGLASKLNTASRRPAEALHHSLGLSIVKRVCLQHNGLFSFSVSPLGGHVASLCMPLRPGKE